MKITNDILTSAEDGKISQEKAKNAQKGQKNDQK